MEFQSPEQAGWVLGEGTRVTEHVVRYEVENGREIWRFTTKESPCPEQWLSWSEVGLGAFVELHHETQGVWLLRSSCKPSFATWLKSQSAIPWETALLYILSLAESLVFAEQAGLFPGELTPSEIGVVEEKKELIFRAQSLILSSLQVSEIDSVSQSLMAGKGLRWVPPAQASGAPWDHEANRYVVGLMLYEMLTGERPFSTKGIRHALNEQLTKGAAPFPPSLAGVVPPGLQSFCLKMLDPSPEQRPKRAQEIVTSLQSFLQPEQRPVVRKKASTTLLNLTEIGPVRRPLPTASRYQKQGDNTASGPGRQSGSGRYSPWLIRARWMPLLVALGIVWWLVGRESSVSNRGNTEQPDRSRVSIRPLQAFTSPSLPAKACASCHPRAYAEWQRSVMAYSAKSPLFQALEILIEEQAGRESRCRFGAGILRRAGTGTSCTEQTSGLPITGSGGEHWCVNCHVPVDNLASQVPAWDGNGFRSTSRQPLNRLVTPTAMEGISCSFCHQVHGPVQPGNAVRGIYEGNPFWTSVTTGQRFFARPEDQSGVFGIANSGYQLASDVFLLGSSPTQAKVAGGVHRKLQENVRSYLNSSEFCGACHDVRLFGTDVLGRAKGEHFKRLRNAYTEWKLWAQQERRAGKQPASCQGCHMSLYPGICVSNQDFPVQTGSRTSVPTSIQRACPPGTHFLAKAPGQYPTGIAATSSGKASSLHSHFFSGVDVPLTSEFRQELMNEPAVDSSGVPMGATQRRDLLLGKTFRFELGTPERRGARLEIPVLIENTGAGHRVPAGFSQEREFWVHLTVRDRNGRVVYEVGKVTRPEEDLHDKQFLTINVNENSVDGQGRPLGMFGADVRDGPDVPQWQPPPLLGGTQFRGKGLINLQNGFLRCVKCIGVIDAQGECQPNLGQNLHRAARFEDGKVDADTGECTSNLSGQQALFETYFPVGSLDSQRGVLKGPDAIIDTRSAPPGVPLRYTYDLRIDPSGAPFKVQARLLFRSFPPFLVKAFIAYESRQTSLGLRPDGPLVRQEMLQRLEIVELNSLEQISP
jgi:eukaryotic-like serine/threonine-protein kinase